MCGPNIFLTMDPRVNVPLSSLTTFRTGGPAQYFFDLDRAEELPSVYSFAQKRDLPFFLLGGGSNTLFKDHGFAGVVARFKSEGISFRERNGEVFVRVTAGVRWDDVVQAVVSRGLFGIENLSFIPGSAGAAPVQNIGAYGTEIADVLDGVEVYDIEHGRFLNLSFEECGFGYRDSFFKRSEGKNFIVIALTIRLSPGGKPNLSYKDLAEYFIKLGIITRTPSVQEVRDAVVAIRKGKLPDVSEIGTAGSFFKNPIIEDSHFRSLTTLFPGIPGISSGGGMVKVPAGWLLDVVGRFKGVSRGRVGVWEKQALVIVNRGGATSAEVISLAQEMAESIWKKTKIALDSEVVIV